ncbi:MAG: LysE family translocator [Pseudomonadota bacterium]
MTSYFFSMTLTDLFAAAAFVFVSTVTPGPNNFLVMTSGTQWGIKPSVKLVAGILSGFILMNLAVGLGLMRVFEAFPSLIVVIKVASTAYLVYLTWKIATAKPQVGGETGTARPMTFVEGALFQLVNPKAWAMIVTALTVYLDTTSLGSVLLLAAGFLAVGIPNFTMWLAVGTQIKRLLSTERRARIFNQAMAALLVLSMVPVLMA